MKMKKMLAMVLAVVMLISAFAVPASAVTLTDISKHWAKDSVQRWVDAEILTGYEDASFKPDNPIKRCEFATILVKTLGLTGTSDKKFTDVPETHWAYNAISSCAAAGIVNGYEDGSFRPENNITRLEAMKMFVVAMQMDTDFSDQEAREMLDEMFNDSSKITWGHQYAATMVSYGAMQGSDGGLNPVGNITRAETAIILDRLLAVYVSKSGAVSVTTKAQVDKKMMCNIVAIHPNTAADVKTGENGEITVTVGEKVLETKTLDGWTPYVLCGTYGGWVHNSEVKVVEGELKRNNTHYLLVKEKVFVDNADTEEDDIDRTDEYFYDEETWQVTKVVETEQDGTVRVKTAEFDDQGRAVKAFDNGVLAVEFIYQDDMLVKQIHYDSEGKQHAVTTYEWKAVDGYDVYRVESATDPAGMYTHRHVRETYYDGSGTLIKELTTDEECYKDLGGRTLQKEEIHYKNGEVSTRVYERYQEGFDSSEPGEMLVARSTEEYVFGEHGIEKLTFVQERIGEDTYTEIHLYAYDEEGNQVSYTHTDAEGNQICKYLFFTKRTETGYEILEERYDEKNVLGSKSIERVNEQTNERWYELYDIDADELVNDCYSVGKEVDGQWIVITEELIYGNKYSSETVYDLVVLPEDHIVQEWYFF